MRPPGFIVKSSSDLCPNILLRIRFRFLFSTLFSRDPPPFPTRETRKYGYRCRLLAVGFSPFFAITRRTDLCSEFHRMGITAAFRTYCVLSKSARKQLFFILPLRLRYSLRFDFLRPCTLLSVPYALTAFLPPKSARMPARRANIRQVRKRLLILRFLAAAAI